jgi:hypothetical protein
LKQAHANRRLQDPEYVLIKRWVPEPEQDFCVRILVKLGKRDKVTPKTQAQGTVEGIMNPEPEIFRNEKRKSLPHF